MIDKPPVTKVIAAQCIAALGVTSVVSVINSAVLSSVVAGLLIAILPYSYFATRVFRFRGAKAATKVAQSFYRAEAGKFVMSATGFALAFMLIQPMHAVFLFAAYVSMIVIQLIGAWWLNQPPAN